MLPLGSLYQNSFVNDCVAKLLNFQPVDNFYGQAVHKCFLDLINGYLYLFQGLGKTLQCITLIWTLVVSKLCSLIHIISLLVMDILFRLLGITAQLKIQTTQLQCNSKQLHLLI